MYSILIILLQIIRNYEHTKPSKEISMYANFNIILISILKFQSSAYRRRFLVDYQEIYFIFFLTGSWLRPEKTFFLTI